MGLYKASAHKRNASAITNPVEFAHDFSAIFWKLASHLSWPSAYQRYRHNPGLEISNESSPDFGGASNYPIVNPAPANFT
jgi:hypothetical protein